jgi:hypothetical protein
VNAILVIVANIMSITSAADHITETSESASNPSDAVNLTTPSKSSKQLLMQPSIKALPVAAWSASAGTRKKKSATDGDARSTDMPERRDQKWQLQLEDRLDLLRYAPRDRALEILHLMLEATYGEGYIRGSEQLKPAAPPGTSLIERD